MNTLLFQKTLSFFILQIHVKNFKMSDDFLVDKNSQNSIHTAEYALKLKRIPAIFRKSSMDIAAMKRSLGEQKKLFEVTFFTNQADSSEYITSITDNIQKNCENLVNRSFFPHLSPNRSISEFRPFFEPSFNIEQTFKTLEKLISTVIDTNLSN